MSLSLIAAMQAYGAGALITGDHTNGRYSQMAITADEAEVVVSHNMRWTSEGVGRTGSMHSRLAGKP